MLRPFGPKNDFRLFAKLSQLLGVFFGSPFNGYFPRKTNNPLFNQIFCNKSVTSILYEELTQFQNLFPYNIFFSQNVTDMLNENIFFDAQALLIKNLFQLTPVCPSAAASIHVSED